MNSLLCHQGLRQRAILSSSSRLHCCRFKSTSTSSSDRAQRAAHDFYRRRREGSWSYWFQRQSAERFQSMQDRNVQVAWYSLAVVIGALGATYAAVPLYKIFCQTTGFGGTTQRGFERDTFLGKLSQQLGEAIGSAIPAGSSKKPSGVRVHTWTDEEAAAELANLKPVENAELITIRFDTTVTDIMPWSFVPVQLDVKVVPGETALSFFRVTNHSDRAITGVATYNVHPAKVGLYFSKIQCFCFEEQRLLPGETVDMPVFFFIHPDILKDPQISYIRSVTLSYHFFQTDTDDDFDVDDEED